jgi:hypothetical protein
MAGLHDIPSSQPWESFTCIGAVWEREDDLRLAKRGRGAENHEMMVWADVA